MITMRRFEAGENSKREFVQKALDYLEERLSSRPIDQPEGRSTRPRAGRSLARQPSSEIQMKAML